MKIKISGTLNTKQQRALIELLEHVGLHDSNFAGLSLIDNVEYGADFTCIEDAQDEIAATQLLQSIFTNIVNA